MSNLFVLKGSKVLLLKIVTFLNILMICLNGYCKTSNVKNSLLVSFMFLGGIFLIGATELITFFVSLESIALMGYALVGLSELNFSKESAVKYLIQGSVTSAIFLLACAFYLGATGTLSFENPTVINQELYAVSLSLLILTACFKLGAFPFHSWVSDVYSNVSNANLATNFFISKIIIGYKFVLVLQMLLSLANPHFQLILIAIVQVIAILSAFYGNILGVVQGQFKRIIAYSSVAHTGYMLMMICLKPNEVYEKQLISYLVIYSLTATGVILILNQFADQNSKLDNNKMLLSKFYSNKYLSILLVIFTLSLAGIPFTAGFSMKYMLFVNFFKEGYTIIITSILISTIIGLFYYIKFMSDLFSEDEIKNQTIKVKTRFSESIIHVIILLSILGVGLMPSLFLEMK